MPGNFLPTYLRRYLPMCARAHECFTMGYDGHFCGKLFAAFQCFNNFSNFFGLLVIAVTNVFYLLVPTHVLLCKWGIHISIPITMPYF